MPLPGKRTPKRRTLIRRSHHALKKATLSACSHCGAKIRPHCACPVCEYYKGKPLKKSEKVTGKKVTVKKEAAKAPKAKAAKK